MGQTGLGFVFRFRIFGFRGVWVEVQGSGLRVWYLEFSVSGFGV